MRKYLLLLLLPIFMSACSSLKTTTEYDPDVDFTQYKTYLFLPWNKQSDEILTDIDKKRFRDAIRTDLNILGYTESNTVADLAINIFIIIDEKTGTTSYNDFYTSGTGVGYYYGPWGYNNPGGVSPVTTMHSYDYQEGTLILDLLDVKKKQLAWQGIAHRTLDSKPKDADQNIKEIIDKLFRDFPIEVKK
ncbi:MAG: DUF4136 domain-containing protein [Bacteroidales bacterium]|nr:DUF4136 domain-containing protein [Bacteroidales bacterium]